MPLKTNAHRVRPAGPETEHVALRLERSLRRLRRRVQRRALVQEIDLLLVLARGLRAPCWWLYSEEDARGLVAQGRTAVEALRVAQLGGWDPRVDPDDAPEVWAVELGQTVAVGRFVPFRARAA
jgi:hypothetical protein